MGEEIAQAAMEIKLMEKDDPGSMGVDYPAILRKVEAGRKKREAIMGDDLVGPLDLTDERWREYDFGGRVYRIFDPQKLWYKPGPGHFHRVLDSLGVVHCVPAPGTGDCVLRWNSKGEPVGF